jgi:hypothetical protein
MWHLSGERMKKGREYFTPLSGSAVDVLRALKPLTGRGNTVVLEKIGRTPAAEVGV